MAKIQGKTRKLSMIKVLFICHGRTEAGKPLFAYIAAKFGISWQTNNTLTTVLLRMAEWKMKMSWRYVRCGLRDIVKRFDG